MADGWVMAHTAGGRVVGLPIKHGLGLSWRRIPPQHATPGRGGLADA
jgi:hypothetical protein